MIGNKPYSDYMTEDCLDAIKTIDGPDYGLRQRDIDKVRELKSALHLDIPSSITSGNIKDMSEEQKRDAAGFLAIANTNELDKAYGEDSDYFFKSMEQFDRSALLTLVHHTGTAKWLKQYNDQTTKATSLLEAAKSGIREDLVIALITNPDGTLSKWPDESLVRNLVAIKLMYDIGNDSFATKKDMDKTFRRWKDNPNLMEDIRGCIKAIAEGDMADVEAFNEQAEIDDASIAETMPQEVSTAENVLPKQSGLSKLTQPIKKLFTNREENVNVAQGNQDINLQQSPSSAGGSANQQLG